jgi:glycopeptide antibiotics resistance protein
LFAIGYLVFVVYGSLVPLRYTPLPWDHALARFQAIPFLQLGIGSRADWVANLLLFIPLTFLWLGWLWPRGVLARVVVSLCLLAAAVGIAVGIEFTQIFYPPRTVSQNDILAECIGAVLGIGFWWWRGPALWVWVQRWGEARGATHVAEYLLLAYLGGLFVYGVLPLDLTISPVEIYHKWKGSGVNLIPFGYPTEGVAEFVYGIVADVVLWIPVSALWVISGRRRPMAAFWMTLGSAFLLEVCQFFVYSRVSDVTDVITAAAGAGIGALAGGRLRQGEGAPAGGRSGGSRPWLLPWILLGVVVWIGVLCLVFWYPFGFRTDAAFLRERLPLLYQVPFYNYYYGSEFRAITEVLHKLLFFAPLGALLALGRFQIRRFSPLRTLYTGLALVIVVGVPLLIELGQVGLAGKNPDSTDWMLEAIGAAAGFVVVIIVRNRMLLKAPPRRTTRGLVD